MSETPKAPLAAADVAAAMAPLAHARAMPAAFYTSPELFTLERKHIFSRHWFFAGREDALPAPGDYRALESPGGPVLLIRGDDKRLRALANVCRHRGSILLEGDGNCRRIVCPYHAWSYRLDGRLQQAPDMEGAADFDVAEIHLPEIRQEIWAGFVFLNFDAEAPALTAHLGDLPARMASHRPAEMRMTWKVTLEGACNWKLIAENAMESYHTGSVHRRSVGRQLSRRLPTQGNWLCIQVLDDRSIATLPGDLPSFPPIEGLDGEARRGTYFTLIHPTCQFALAQDSLWWLSLRPRAADRTEIEIGGCFPESVTRLQDFDARAAAYYKRWEMVGREDMAILERQQRALASALYRPGRLSPRDDQVQAAARWVLGQIPEAVAGQVRLDAGT